MDTYIVVFFTHSGAIKFDRNCKKKSIDCELMPVPRKLSSSCGVCARIHFNGDLQTLLSEDIEKIFVDLQGDMKKVYDSE